MIGWKMIGYPGARFNERYPFPPVSIKGRAAWTPKS
jgi:gluconate 2-dehydrogenase gamma chain